MRLLELLDGTANRRADGRAPWPRDLEIAGLSADSRAIKPGFLFAALPGSQADGRAFVPQALANGAVAVLGPPGIGDADATEHVAFIEDENPRRRLALLAARFFGQQPETVAAVTGTNGKTSVAVFTRQIWAHLGKQAASLGTLGIAGPDFEHIGALTTPDPIALQSDLADLAKRGVDHLAMEASSHGLEQFRLDGVRVKAAAFTNLSRDHLDYHGSMDAYLAAKLRLFSELLDADGIAVVNADSDAAAVVRKAAGDRRVIEFGERADGDGVQLVHTTPKPSGLDIEMSVAGTRIEASVPLVGTFQAKNILAALGLAVACGAGAREAAEALPALKGAPGRVERAGRHRNGAAVYVDYAHTPDALETVLEAVRPHTEGSLSVVFGCGGDRDPGKRPMMGKAAAGHADRVIVTDDNPRSEDPAAIRRAALEGAPDAIEIGDRTEAIAAAIEALGPGDLLVIAGKGHERGQIVGDTVLPFDDRDVARAALRETGGHADD